MLVHLDTEKGPARSIVLMLQLLMMQLLLLLTMRLHTRFFLAPLSVFTLALPIPCISLPTLLISIHHSLTTGLLTSCQPTIYAGRVAPRVE